jgi:hypothetical protein
MRILKTSMMTKCLVAVVLVGANTACDKDIHRIQHGHLQDKNPVWYVFPFPAEHVRQKVLAALEGEGLRDLYTSLGSEGPLGQHDPFSFSIQSIENAIIDPETFANPDFRNDIFLLSDGKAIGPSTKYFGGGKPLKYTADFHLHISAVDAENTVVTVMTINPRVHNGLRCCGPHGSYTNYESVEPSTVEEYTILLFIGRVLGHSDMPPIRLPEVPSR